MAAQLGLGERRLEVELALEAHPGRDVAEELVDRRDADRREHLLAVGVGERAGSRVGQVLLLVLDVEEAVDLARVGEADADEPALAVGSSLTVSGASTTFWFTSRISPESGAITSETAFTDSTSP